MPTMKLGCPCWEGGPQRRQSRRKSPRLEGRQEDRRRAPSRRTQVCLPGVPGCACQACPCVPAWCARVYLPGMPGCACPGEPAWCGWVCLSGVPSCACLVCPGEPAWCARVCLPELPTHTQLRRDSEIRYLWYMFN